MLAQKHAISRPAQGMALRASVVPRRPSLATPRLLSSDSSRIICRTSESDASKKSVDGAPKVTLRDIVDQMDPSIKQGEKTRPWIVSRFLIFRSLTKRMRLRRLGRRFLPRLLARLGRGVIVALPAVGLLFAFSLAIADYKRFKQEQAEGDQVCARCFRFATWMDLGDVALHVIALVGLLHVHYSFGVGIPENVAHYADVASPVIVIASFISATVGEFLSAKRAAIAAATSSEDEGDEAYEPATA